jgi:hypothetical protein
MMQASPFISPFVKTRFWDLAKALEDAAKSDEPQVILDGQWGVAIASAVDTAIERMDGAAELAQPRMQTTWTGTWRKSDGTPLEDGKRSEVTALTVWDFYKAVKRVGRELPRGCLEWASEAKPGCKAKWLDGEKDMMFVLEVEAW